MRATTSARARKHHAALREAGLRPVQIWVPDTQREGFAAECRRQSLLLQSDQLERETVEWLDNAADRGGWQ